MSFDVSNANNLVGTVEGFVRDHDEFRRKVKEVNARRDLSVEYKRARVEAMADEFREAHAGTVQAITDAEKRFQADVDAYSNGVDLDSDYMGTLSRAIGMFGAKMPPDVTASLVSKAKRPWEARMAAAAFENAGIKSGPGAASARAQALTPGRATARALTPSRARRRRGAVGRGLIAPPARRHRRARETRGRCGPSGGGSATRRGLPFPCAPPAVRQICQSIKGAANRRNRRP